MNNNINNFGDMHNSFNEYLNSTVSFSEHILRIPVPDKRPYCSRFSYNSGNCEFIGRNNEMRNLIKFCKDERKILWWAITGAGGSGKSRLAYELSKEMDAKFWVVRNIMWPTFTMSFNYQLAWEFNHDILLIIDYVHAYEREIGNWISWIEQTSGNLTKKIRILLIERDTQKTHAVSGIRINPSWFEFLYDGFSEANYVWGLCYNEKFMVLGSLDDISAEGIIISYCKNVSKRDVPLKVIEQIIRHTKMIYNSSISPLYLQCFSDAWLENNNIQNWNRDNIYQYIYSREIKRIFQTLNIDGAVLKAETLKFYTTATVLGSLNLNDSIIRGMQQIGWITVSEKKFEDLIDAFHNSSLLQGSIIYGVEPDLIGEYFVFQNISLSCDRNKIYSFFNLLYNQYENETLRFLLRFTKDYAIELKKIGIYDDIISMVGDERKNTFTIINDLGNEVECEVLFTFDSDETQKSYIVYTDNTQDEAHNTKVYASIFDPSLEETKLEPIESEKEWGVIETILNELQSETKNAMIGNDEIDLEEITKRIEALDF